MPRRIDFTPSDVKFTPGVIDFMSGDIKFTLGVIDFMSGVIGRTTLQYIFPLKNID